MFVNGTQKVRNNVLPNDEERGEDEESRGATAVTTARYMRKQRDEANTKRQKDKKNEIDWGCTQLCTNTQLGPIAETRMYHVPGFRDWLVECRSTRGPAWSCVVLHGATFRLLRSEYGRQGGRWAHTSSTCLPRSARTTVR